MSNFNHQITKALRTKFQSKMYETNRVYDSLMRNDENQNVHSYGGSSVIIKLKPEKRPVVPYLKAILEQHLDNPLNYKIYSATEHAPKITNLLTKQQLGWFVASKTFLNNETYDGFIFITIRPNDFIVTMFSFNDMQRMLRCKLIGHNDKYHFKFYKSLLKFKNS